MDSVIPAIQQIACGSENCFALSKDGEMYSWGLNFKGQLGLGDFENRHEPTLVDTMMAPDSTLGSSQNKKNILSVIKRSKSKEATGGSIT